MAAEKGYLEIAKVLIDKGASPDEPTVEGNITPLMLAVQNKHLEIAELIANNIPYIFEQYKAFEIAVETHQFEMVKVLIQESCHKNSVYDTNKVFHKIIEQIRYANNVNEKDDQGWTAMHHACHQGNLEAAKMLFKLNARIDCKQNSQKTPLHLATRNGHLDIVKFLCEAKASINAKTIHGTTALHMAVEKGHLEIVKYLISKDAQVNVKTTKAGITPLILAIQNRNLEISKVLIDKSPEFEDVGTELLIAIKSLQVEIVQYIVESLTVSITQDVKFLYQIVLEGSDNDPACLKIIDLIINYVYCCDTVFIDDYIEDVFNDTKYTPLQIAVKSNKRNMVKSLLKHGAGVNELDGSFELSALAIAVQENNLGMAKLLLEHGADTNISSIDCALCVPLFIAIKNDNFEIVKLLLENGDDIEMQANIDEMDTLGTPLYYAIDPNNSDPIGQNNLKIINFLIDKTADVGFKTDFGNSILHEVAMCQRKGLMKIFISRGAKVNEKNSRRQTPLHLAVQFGNDNIDVVKELIELGGDLETRDDTNATPLFLAVTKGYKNKAKELINHGADINCKNKHGFTLLHVCIKKGYEDIAKVLVHHGADVNSKITTDDYLSLPFYAITYGQEKIAKLLVENKADLQQRTKDGKSALDYARSTGQKEIIQIFIKQMIKNSEEKEKIEAPPAKRQKFDEDCVICYNPRNGIFAMTPCGHAKTCELCCLKIIDTPESKCPVCRISVDSHIKVFY